VERCERDASVFRQGPVAGHCEHGNELLGSMKGRKFLDHLSDC